MKETLGKRKGITLIALSITIIVLLVLAGVTIGAVSGNNGILNKAVNAKKKNDQAEKDEKIRTEYLSSVNKKGEISLSRLNEKLVSLGYEGGEITSLPQIIEISGTNYLITDENIKNINDEFNTEKKVNIPKLSSGMIPIKYDTAKNTWVICSQNDSEWYNYIGTTTSDFKWANVMLSDGKYKEGSAKEGTEVSEADLGSMFVWIPRYAYSINEYKVAKNAEGTIQGITNVTFLISNSNIGINSSNEYETYKTDYSTDQVEKAAKTQTTSTPKIAHPGFKFGDSDLTGIWVAKFEASMEETNTNTDANNDVTNKTVKILPNAESWRYIRIGKAFTNCLNMKSNTKYGINGTADSHLTKNIEWGAIAYLSASQYGTTPTINNSGSSYKEDGKTKFHSYSAKGNYKTYVTQSTTGNITGIYDLSGGAWEKVAAYYDNGQSNISSQGTTTYFSSSNNKLKEEYEKYWDKYEIGSKERTNGGTLYNAQYSEDNNKAIREIADERYEKMKEKKGDSMYEVMKYQTYSYFGKLNDGKNSNSWINYPITAPTGSSMGTTIYNGDIALLGNCTYTFMHRGAYWSNGTGTGIFASFDHTGSTYAYAGFRPVIVVE